MLDAEIAEVAFDASNPTRRELPIVTRYAADGETVAIIADLASRSTGGIGAARFRHRLAADDTGVKSAPIVGHQGGLRLTAEKVVHAEFHHLIAMLVSLKKLVTGGRSERVTSADIDIERFRLGGPITA